MTKNDLISLLESNSPLDYHILKPSVSFVQLCASYKDGLIHPLGTFTLTKIDHMSIMKSSVMKPPHRKEVESPANVTLNMLPYMGIEPRQIPILEV